MRGFTFARGISSYGMFAIDVTVTRESVLHIIEVNGSNAALSSTAVGTDHARALNMALAFQHRVQHGPPASILLAHRPKLQFLAEFYGRAVILRDLLSGMGYDVELVNADERPGNHDFALVCGSIPDIVDHIERHDNGLEYRGRPVVFAQNPNLVPELVRRGVVRLTKTSYDIELNFFHEGASTLIIHDKVRQQELADGTGFEPLRSTYAWSYDQCLEIIAEFHEVGLTPVGKGFGGSGGAAIGFFPPGADSAIILNQMMLSAQTSYGDKAAKSI